MQDLIPRQRITTNDYWKKKKKRELVFPRQAYLLVIQHRVVSPGTIYTKQQKMDSVSCIYLFVHTHTYIYTCVCNKKFKEKVAINSRVGREHEKC